MAKGICDGGAYVFDIGLAGTEEVYASFRIGTCAGIEVTASHNPIDYNSMVVRHGSQPLNDQEFDAIKDWLKAANLSSP